MIAILQAAFGIATDRLDMGAFVRCDADFAPGGRDGELIDACFHCFIVDRLAEAITIGKALAAALAPQLQRRGLDISETETPAECLRVVGHRLPNSLGPPRFQGGWMETRANATVKRGRPGLGETEPLW